MILKELRRRFRQIIGPVLAIAVVGYFAYHIVQGDRGLLAMLKLLRELEEDKTKLKGLLQEKARLEHRAKLLKAESLDPDMLNEQARRLLGVVDPEDCVILKNPLNSKK